MLMTMNNNGIFGTLAIQATLGPEYRGLALLVAVAFFLLIFPFSLVCFEWEVWVLTHHGPEDAETLSEAGGEGEGGGKDASRGGRTAQQGGGGKEQLQQQQHLATGKWMQLQYNASDMNLHDPDGKMHAVGCVWTVTMGIATQLLVLVMAASPKQSYNIGALLCLALTRRPVIKAAAHD